MMVILGYVIVLGAVLGSFVMAGGNPVLLWQPAEIVAICGVALGSVVVAAPTEVMKNLLNDVKNSFTSKGLTKGEVTDLFKLLYEIFVLGRRSGLIALDEHVSDPEHSTILQKYPSFLHHKDRVEFLTSALRPAIDGKVKPDQLKMLLETEIEAKEEEAGQSVMLLGMVGDSLPGIGIVAAVLGIINTMASIADGPEKVGEHVAAALTGTLLGVLLAYGIINPLAKRITFNHAGHFVYFQSMSRAIGGFTTGLSPIMAIEIARRGLDQSLQPGADELEQMLKAAAMAKAPTS